MVRLNRIAKEENPDLPFILLGHSMGSFAAQQYVLDHSREIDGLMLSGSGALDGLARLASSAIRCAAASVSFITCGRGRGFGLETDVGEAGVMSFMWAIQAANQYGHK